MEEKQKKGKTSLYVIILAILLIGVGAGLIVTGNNKSFLKEKKTENNESNENKDKENDKEQPTEDPQRGVVPAILTEEQVINLIVQNKNKDMPNETWSVGRVEIIAHDENNEKFLVIYEELNEDGTVRNLFTIVTVLGEDYFVELPGWEENERDLTIYNFIYYETESDEEITPVEPNNQEESGEITENNETVDNDEIVVSTQDEVQTENENVVE